jgi:hypothetical protein
LAVGGRLLVPQRFLSVRGGPETDHAQLNSLQAEVGELRKQLRQVRGGTPGK